MYIHFILINNQRINNLSHVIIYNYKMIIYYIEFLFHVIKPC